MNVRRVQELYRTGDWTSHVGLELFRIRQTFITLIYILS